MERKPPMLILDYLLDGAVVRTLSGTAVTATQSSSTSTSASATKTTSQSTTTNSATLLPESTPKPSSQSSSLSSGAIASISVGVVIIVVIVLAALIFFFLRRRQQRNAAAQPVIGPYSDSGCKPNGTGYLPGKYQDHPSHQGYYAVPEPSKADPYQTEMTRMGRGREVSEMPAEDARAAPAELNGSVVHEL